MRREGESDGLEGEKTCREGETCGLADQATDVVDLVDEQGGERVGRDPDDEQVQACHHRTTSRERAGPSSRPAPGEGDVLGPVQLALRAATQWARAVRIWAQPKPSHTFS